MHQSELLVGDLMVIANGMEVPADGMLTYGADITADESAMTGETLPIKKDILIKATSSRDELVRNDNKDPHELASPIMMSGSRVLSGEGKMIVIAVGKYSALGKIQALLGAQEETVTPLQMKLEKIAEDIGKFGLISAIFIVLVLLIRFLIQEGMKDKDVRFGSYTGGYIVSYIIIGITVIVVAIPEGLPLAVTLSLAFSVKKMLYDQNLVR